MLLADIMELEHELGPTIVAALSANRNRHIVQEWIEFRAAPSVDEESRLQTALDLFRKVGAAESPDTARQWFISLNTPAGTSPLMAIHAGDFADARTSAGRFIDQGRS